MCVIVVYMYMSACACTYVYVYIMYVFVRACMFACVREREGMEGEGERVFVVVHGNLHVCCRCIVTYLIVIYKALPSMMWSSWSNIH